MVNKTKKGFPSTGSSWWPRYGFGHNNKEWRTGETEGGRRWQASVSVSVRGCLRKEMRSKNNHRMTKEYNVNIVHWLCFEMSLKSCFHLYHLCNNCITLMYALHFSSNLLQPHSCKLWLHRPYVYVDLINIGKNVPKMCL